MSAEVARIGSEDSAVPAASHCGFDYTGCYCEENAWLLCQQLCDNGQASEDDLHVIFVSNPEQQVWMFSQRAGHGQHGAVCWDYHVLVVQQRNSGTLVWDLDSTLPLPCCIEQFVAMALRPNIHLPLPRRYRVVPWPLFRQQFASDRRHMRNVSGGWQMPPPPWSCICPAGSQPGSHNLARYIDMQLPHELGLPQRCAVAAGHTIPSNDDARCQQNSGSASQQPHGISIEQAALVDRVALTAPGSSQGHFGEVLQEAAFLARFRTLQSTA